VALSVTELLAQQLHLLILLDKDIDRAIRNVWTDLVMGAFSAPEYLTWLRFAICSPFDTAN
jgi:hypothetical protein